MSEIRDFAALAGTIVRQRIDWAHWDSRKGKMVTTHPTVWIWADEEGYERVFNTKAEAMEAMYARDASELDAAMPYNAAQ